MRRIFLTLVVILALCIIWIGIINERANADVSADWGEKYNNDSGQTICICSEKDQCYPCAALPD